MTTGILVRRLLRNNSAISDDIIGPQLRHMQVSNNIFKHYIVGNLTKKQLQVKKKKKKISKYRIQRTVERVVQLSIPSTCTAAGTSEEGINSWSSKNKIK